MINLKKSFLFLIFINLNFYLKAEEVRNQEVFSKVFGKSIQKNRVALPLYFEDKYIGEIDTDLEGESILGFPANSMIPVLRKIIIEKSIKELVGLKKVYLLKEDLKFEIKYNPALLRLDLLAKEDLIRPIDNLFQESLIPYFAKDAKQPAPFSGAINWRAEESISHNDSTASFLSANISNFLNLKNYVLDNQWQYASNRDSNKWYRGNTTITKDDERNAVRYILGDNSSNTYGYLISQNFGGISISRDYSITPYRISSPSSNQEFSVENRSIVRYFVNNNLLKTEFLNAGKYNVKNIPLNNGLNKIVVEVEDEFGNKKYYNFKESFSNDLLRNGDSKFDLSVGKSATDVNYKKEYDRSNQVFTSAYYKRGWTDTYTSGFYEQNKGASLLVGIENLFSSKVGNWGIGAARSKHTEGNGFAYNLNYFLSSFTNSINNNQSLSLRLEKRDLKFNEGLDFSLGRYEYNANTTYSLPVFDWASMGIGLNASKPFNHLLADKYGIDTSLTGRAFKNSSLTLYLSNIRDEYKKWNQLFYVFLNFSFDEGSSYVSSYYDTSSQTKRISYYHDQGLGVNNIKVLSSIEKSKYSSNGDLDLSINAKLVELGFRETASEKFKNHYANRTNIRALSALTFVNDQNEFKFGISRPITNSFAIIAPNELLKNQKLGLKSSGNRTEASSGLFDEVVVRDMIPYQYRRLQIDPSKLRDGFSLEQESFIIYPTYKSGHLILAKALGSIAIKGTLLNISGEPIVLTVGEIITSNGITIPFFTNKSGRFFIEGINPGTVKFLLDDEKLNSESVTIKSDQTGIVDLGSVKFNKKGMK